MYYSLKRGYLNILLLIAIVMALLALIGWLGYNIGRNAFEGSIRQESQKTILNSVQVPLVAISLAQNANLQKTTGSARIGAEEGKVEIDILLAENISLPERSSLAGWLVDSGKLGGLGESSASQADQQYGTPFANVDFSKYVDNAPYALSLGNIIWDSERGTWHLFFEANNKLGPYDAVMITIESDSNTGNFDPRPGTPILIGEIK